MRQTNSKEGTNLINSRSQDLARFYLPVHFVLVLSVVLLCIFAGAASSYGFKISLTQNYIDSSASARVWETDWSGHGNDVRDASSGAGFSSAYAEINDGLFSGMEIGQGYSVETRSGGNGEKLQNVEFYLQGLASSNLAGATYDYAYATSSGSTSSSYTMNILSDYGNTGELEAKLSLTYTGNSYFSLHVSPKDQIGYSTPIYTHEARQPYSEEIGVPLISGEDYYINLCMFLGPIGSWRVPSGSWSNFGTEVDALVSISIAESTYSPIPEPCTVLLIGTGLVALGLFRNRYGHRHRNR